MSVSLSPSTQLAVSAAVACLVYFAYERGKPLVKDIKSVTGQGISVEWKDPVLIERRDRNLQKSGQTLPACQVWDDTYQVFFNVKDLQAMGSQTECFRQHTVDVNPRFLAKDGTTTYLREDPLSDPDNGAGTCWFQMDPTADDPKPPPFSFFNMAGTISAPNKSARLCFAAGETAEEAGRYFVGWTGTLATMNPVVSYDNSGQNLPTPRCERYGIIPATGGSTITQLLTWYHDGILPDTTMDACLANASMTSPVRWVDQESFIFKNPNTQDTVQMKREPF